MQTHNPAFTNKRIEGMPYTEEESMTLNGTLVKTFLLFAFLLTSSIFTWYLYFSRGMSAIIPFLAVGGIGGFIVSLITIFRQKSSPITAPIYAILEGLFLGGLSAFFEEMYPGVVIQSVGLTFGVLALMLIIYSTGIIKVTSGFMRGVIAGTAALALFYLVTMVLNLAGVSVPYMHSAGPFGLIISAVAIVLACLNLILDFNFIERLANEGNVPVYMEWYAAFGLMLTLVWLYLEILRLMGRLRN